MISNKFMGSLCILVALAVCASSAGAAEKKKAETGPALSESGKQLEAKYAKTLAELKAEIAKILPAVDEQKKAAFQKAHAEAEALEVKADAAKASASDVAGLQAKIANWKKYWFRKADQGIAKAEADLKAATTDAQRAAAKKDIEKWQANKVEGEVQIAKAQAELDQATKTNPAKVKVSTAAQEQLAAARKTESEAQKALLSDVEPFLKSDKADAKLVKAALLAHATPHGLAAFAQQGKEQESAVDSLLADDKLMKEMLIAGGAMHGYYGQAMTILTAIRKASPKANDGLFHRLAVATSLELAKSATAISTKTQAKKTADADTLEVAEGSAEIDPVKCYLDYEKTYLKGELDPAFKTFSTWEYRMVVSDYAGEEVMAWGREMIRNYRPDFVTMPNYGWRYSALVKSDVTYGSENCKNDRAELNQFQNILKDGGVCGRRAFFGRFILRANGIPVWSVTQHKHAALSHWTPKGWVVNLGAGFEHSWWDKGEVPTSGSDFLLETQARRHPEEYMMVLRAQWVGRALGEPAYNGRKNVAGGTWSNLGHYEATLIAAQEVSLAPLGAEFAEANVPAGADDAEQAAVTKDDQKVDVSTAGQVIIPAVAKGKSSGTAVAMKSAGSGMQLLGSAGFKAQYEFVAPKAGKYSLSAKVVTVQENKRFTFAFNNSKAVEVAVPYTIGMWQQTPSIEVNLNQGRNTFQFEILGEGRLAIKEFILKPTN